MTDADLTHGLGDKGTVCLTQTAPEPSIRGTPHADKVGYGETGGLGLGGEHDAHLARKLATGEAGKGYVTAASTEQHLALQGAEKARKSAQQGRLAYAVGTNEAGQLTGTEAACEMTGYDLGFAPMAVADAEFAEKNR